MTRPTLRVLVTRPQPGGEATARRLAERGHQGLAVPLFTIEPTAEPPPAGAPVCLAVTSQNAVPALAGYHAAFAHLPVFAVGPRTGRALAEAGFDRTRILPHGDGAALARAIAAALPADAAVLHVGGFDRRPEPERSLRAAGFAVSVWETYRARAVPVLPVAIGAALSAGALDIVLHFSRRGAETLVRRTEEAGLATALRPLLHLCLSEEVGRGLGALDPARVAVAAVPSEAALLDLLRPPAGPDPGSPLGPPGC